MLAKSLFLIKQSSFIFPRCSDVGKMSWIPKMDETKAVFTLGLDYDQIKYEMGSHQLTAVPD